MIQSPPGFGGIEITTVQDYLLHQPTSVNCHRELRRERNNLYKKQNDLKGQKYKEEKSLER